MNVIVFSSFESTAEFLFFDPCFSLAIDSLGN